MDINEDCKGCNLLVTNESIPAHPNDSKYCAIRDLHLSDNCPCRLCIVKPMCNGNISVCPNFQEHLVKQIYKHK